MTCPEPGLCEEALRPNSTRPCNTHPCTQWVVGPWGQVSQRGVSCREHMQRGDSCQQASIRPLFTQGVVECVLYARLSGPCRYSGGQMRSPPCCSLQPTRETDLKEKGMCAVMSGKAFRGGDFRARLEGFVM